MARSFSPCCRCVTPAEVNAPASRDVLSQAVTARSAASALAMIVCFVGIAYVRFVRAVPFVRFALACFELAGLERLVPRVRDAGSARLATFTGTLAGAVGTTWRVFRPAA